MIEFKTTNQLINEDGKVFGVLTISNNSITVSIGKASLSLSIENVSELAAKLSDAKRVHDNITKKLNE